MSQTRAEVREINDAIRERLRERCLLAGNENSPISLTFAHLLSSALSYVKVPSRACPKCSQIRPKNTVGGQRSGQRAEPRAKFFSRSHETVIRVYDEAGKVIEITRRLQLSPLRGNQLAFRGRECQSDRALVVAMRAQSVRLLFRA